MSQLFQRKPIAALVEDTQGENSLKRSLGAGDLIMLAIGAVIGQNFNPQFPDVMYLITRHAEEPTTYEAVVVWRPRKSDRQSPGPGFILIR
jgi:hypothetical protein